MDQKPNEMKNLLIIVFLLSVHTLFCQTKQFKGTWTKINTTYIFEFDLILKINKTNQVEGYFNWKVVQSDEKDSFMQEYYEPRLGKTAKEYVKGTYDPVKGVYKLRGCKKDDPHQIIALDTYELAEDKAGDVGGKTFANGTWLGRINGKEVEMDLL